MVTGRPLFPAIDENELLEFFVIRVGMPPKEMIDKARKKRQFFDKNNFLIRSRQSRIPTSSTERSETIKKALYSETDDDFIDFIEKCLIIDPEKRMKPE